MLLIPKFKKLGGRDGSGRRERKVIRLYLKVCLLFV
jgi:hypothetical protein